MFEVVLFKRNSDESISNIFVREVHFDCDWEPVFPYSVLPTITAKFILPQASPEICQDMELSSNFCLYMDGIGYKVICVGMEFKTDENYKFSAEMNFTGNTDKCTCENHISYMQSLKNKQEDIPKENIIDEVSNKVSNKFELLDI